MKMTQVPADLPVNRGSWGRVLLRPREQAFWLYAVVIALGAWSTLVQQHVLEQIDPSGFALSWFLLALFVIPAVVLIARLDVTRMQPRSLLAGGMLWGAVAATAFARVGEGGWGLVVARLGGPDFAARWSAALTAAPIEETTKVLGVIVLAMIARDEFRDPFDGFLYGALVGLGFAIVEDVMYFVAVFGGTPSDVLKGFLVRVVADGIYGHVLWTGLSGLGVAYFVSMRGYRTIANRTAVAGGMLLVAMAGHFLWDSPLLQIPVSSWLMVAVAGAVKGLPFVAFATILITLARHQERRGLNAALEREALAGSILPDELPTLESGAARRQAQREMRARAGRDAAKVLGRLQREQLRLAALLERYGGSGVANRQRAVCARVRGELDTLTERAAA
jgi:RsiW-degrading membrane proteinase PrsW (M82 family)